MLEVVEAIVGEDESHAPKWTADLELLRLGYRVYTVDPTPDSIKFVRETAPQLKLMAVGVWTAPGDLEFHRSEIYSDSWSAAPPAGADGPLLRAFP